MSTRGVIYILFGALVVAAAFIAGQSMVDTQRTVYAEAGAAVAEKEAPAKVVNDTCPITGLKFDPAKVSDNRIREFDGKKIGFCCPKCPPVWDKLTDEQKREKLDKVMPKPMPKTEAKPEW